MFCKVVLVPKGVLAALDMASRVSIRQSQMKVSHRAWMRMGATYLEAMYKAEHQRLLHLATINPYILLMGDVRVKLVWRITCAGGKLMSSQVLVLRWL